MIDSLPSRRVACKQLATLRHASEQLAIRKQTGVRELCPLAALSYFNLPEQFAYEALHSLYIGLVDAIMIVIIGRPLSTTYVILSFHVRTQ